MSRPVLLIGANGQVGREALPLLQSVGGVVSMTRSDLDLTDAESIRESIRRLRPRWIVNAAAYTAVDKAETDARTAFAINRDAPGILGEEALRLGAAVIHFSTDYVFSGAGSRPWVEEDATGPLGVYGASKLAGERALAESGAAHFIFRTSWVFGAQGQNFLLRILQLAKEREELKVVDDQHGSPTWARTLAELAVHSIQKVEADAQRAGTAADQSARMLGGLYHACSSGCTTWFGFASEFLSIAKAARPDQSFARLIPIPSSDYPTPAARPLNSRLSCKKLEQQLGFALPSWQRATAQVIEDLRAKGRL